MDRFLSLLFKLIRLPDFAGLLASSFALGMAYSFVVPFMSIWGTQVIGMTPFVFGTFMTTTSLSSILLGTVLARWSDTHLTRRTMLILGASGGLLGYCGYALVRDPVWLTLIGATVLAVASVSFSQMFAHVRETFGQLEDKDLDPGFVMSVLRVSFSFSWTVGPALGAWAANFGAREVFFGAATLYGVFLACVLAFVPHRKHPPHARLAASQPLWRVLRRGDILVTFAAFTLFFTAHAINMMNLPLAVKTALGGTAGDLGIVFGIGPVVEIPLMIWFGHLATRGYQVGLIRLGVVSTVLYFVALSFASIPWHVYPSQILSGVSFAILTNVTILFYQDLLPGQRGLATTIFSNSINLGNLAGYFSYGTLAGRAGSRGVFVICAVLSAVALAILLCYRHRPVAGTSAAAV